MHINYMCFVTLMHINCQWSKNFHTNISLQFECHSSAIFQFWTLRTLKKKFKMAWTWHTERLPRFSAASQGSALHHTVQRCITFATWARICTSSAEYFLCTVVACLTSNLDVKQAHYYVSHTMCLHKLSHMSNTSNTAPETFKTDETTRQASWCSVAGYSFWGGYLYSRLGDT